MNRHAHTCSYVCALRQLSSLQDPINFHTSSLSNKCPTDKTVITGYTMYNIHVQLFICRSRWRQEMHPYTKDPATSGRVVLCWLVAIPVLKSTYMLD